MKALPRKQAPISLSPGLRADDALANYWLRQVTVRLRREISWQWYERGGVLGAHGGVLPPLVDRAQAALDLSRFWEEKKRFFRSDPTACYLTEMLEEEPAPPPGPPVRGSFSWVVAQLALDDVAAFVLALGLAAAFDNALGSVLAACLNDPGRTQPTLAVAQKLWDDPQEILAVVDPNHVLFRYGLLRLGSGPQSSHVGIDWDRALWVPATVAQHLLLTPASLPSCLRPLNGDEPSEAALTAGARLVAARLTAMGTRELRLVPLKGPKGSGYREVVQAVSHFTRRPVFQFSAPPMLLAHDGYLEALATLGWLRGFDLFFDADLIAAVMEDKTKAVNLLPGLAVPITIFLAVSDQSHLTVVPGRNLLPALEVPEFPFGERLAFWRRTLGEEALALEPTIRECARRFRYGKDTILSICTGLKALPGSVTPAEVTTACRGELEVDIGDLAQKVAPRFHDETLILPPKQERQFREVGRAMKALTEVHYGWGTAKVWNEGGIAVLFAGPPGTGKTMAAEILALELDLPIYRIDLSQVVNKYVGETEKNLKRLFDAADVSDLLLFFDEADALFGQRTEVKDAHDRYANLEISYLLERMERFKGLAILATNRKKDLDEAFLRRLRYIIDFPLPEAEQRRKIWLQVIPRSVDSSGLDIDFLARQFPLTGGHIRSIVFNACLQSAKGAGLPAASGTRRLSMPEIIVALKRECDKLKRSMSLEQFGPYASIVAGMDYRHETR